MVRIRDSAKDSTKHKSQNGLGYRFVAGSNIILEGQAGNCPMRRIYLGTLGQDKGQVFVIIGLGIELIELLEKASEIAAEKSQKKRQPAEHAASEDCQQKSSPLGGR